MMAFGTEEETTELDDSGSTLTVIRKIRGSEVAKTIKHFRIRIKVRDQKEQMVEYMKHADKVREKREAGILVIKDDNPLLLPQMVTEFPKNDVDGSWFVVSCWAEWM